MERFGEIQSLTEKIPEENPSVLEKTEAIKISKIESAFESIDKQVLKDIFLEIFKAAGTDSVLDRFMADEKVRVAYIPSKKMRGMFYPGAGNVEDSAVTLNAAAFDTSSDIEVRLAVLYVYTHEQVHAMSTDLIFQKDFFDNKDKRFIGFEHQEKKLGEAGSKISYRELNEGMTEIIAEEVAYEYLRRTGEVDGKKRDIHHAQHALNVYRDYKILVDTVISRLASEYTLPKEVIKKALIHAYFTNKTLHSNFTDWLEENHSSIARTAFLAR